MQLGRTAEYLTLRQSLNVYKQPLSSLIMWRINTITLYQIIFDKSNTFADIQIYLTHSWKKIKNWSSIIIDTSFWNRGDKIRTCDFHVPNVALYQTEPHLDISFYVNGAEGNRTPVRRPIHYSFSHHSPCFMHNAIPSIKRPKTGFSFQ